MERKTGSFRTSPFAGLLFALILVAALIPVGFSILLTMKEYRPAMGLSSSPWVGLRNYQILTQTPIFSTLLGNSVLLGILSYLGSLLLGIAAAWFVPLIRGRGRYAALDALLLPTFVPTACWAAGLIPLLTGQPDLARPYYLAVAILSGAGLIGFAGAAWGIVSPRGGLWRGVGLASLLLVFLYLTPNQEMLRLLQTPLSYQTTDTLDTYAYRMGLIQGEYGVGAAAYILKLVLQLAAGSVVCAVAALLWRKEKAQAPAVPDEERGIPTIAWALPAAALLALAVFFLSRGLTLQSQGAREAIAHSLPGQGAMALLAGVIALCAAWAMISTLRTAGRGAFCALSGLLLVTTYPVVGQYLWFRQLGLVNTVLAPSLATLYTPGWLLLTLLCARLSGADSLRDRPVIYLALLPACFAAAKAWSDWFAPMTYLTTRENMPTGLLLRESVITGQAPDTSAYLLALLPALLLCALGAFALVCYFGKDTPTETAE